MEKQGLAEWIKNNKATSIILLCVLLVFILDAYVLRPMRKAKELEKKGVKRIQTQSSTTTSKSSVTPKTSGSKITPPSPLVVPVFPELSTNIVGRFTPNAVYPYHNGRNIFKEIDKPKVVMKVVDKIEEIIEKPDISYHGFFTVGNDKVAILKNSNELLLTRVGNKVRRTTFKLASISPERVVVTDVSNKLRDFEISLADETESN